MLPTLVRIDNMDVLQRIGFHNATSSQNSTEMPEALMSNSTSVEVTHGAMPSGDSQRIVLRSVFSTVHGCATTAKLPCTNCGRNATPSRTKIVSSMGSTTVRTAYRWLHLSGDSP